MSETRNQNSLQVIDIATNYSDRIIHETKVDFMKHTITKSIRLMQYDNSIPIIAVHLYKDDEPFILPENCEVMFRWSKKDFTYIRDWVLGCDSTRQIVYLEVSDNMSFYPGEVNPILELKIGGKVAGSTYFPITIDRNPVQRDDVQSSVDDKYVETVIDEFNALAETAMNDITTATNETIPNAVNSAKSDINNAVSSAKNDINTTADNVKNEMTNAVSDAKVEVNQAVDTAVNSSVPNAVKEATDEAIRKIGEINNTFEVGSDGQTTPSDSLMIGGIFYEKI